MKNFNNIMIIILLGILTSCSQKKEKLSDVNADITQEAASSPSKVNLPVFENIEVQSFASEYHHFVNDAYVIYDEFELNSSEYNAWLNEYKNDSERYFSKMKEVTENASEKDRENLEKFMIEKREELNSYAQNRLAE